MQESMFLRIDDVKGYYKSVYELRLETVVFALLAVCSEISRRKESVGTVTVSSVHGSIAPNCLRGLFLTVTSLGSC